LIQETLPGWGPSGHAINTQGVTKLVANLRRYVEQARYVQPVLCIADTDHHCPVELVNRWMPQGSPEGFLLRLAVSEAECWVLADREGVAEFFGVALARVPTSPEAEIDAKKAVLRLARRSSKRQLRQEMVSQLDMERQGSGYSFHLTDFVSSRWQPARAVDRSNSLQRAIARLRMLPDLVMFQDKPAS